MKIGEMAFLALSIAMIAATIAYLVYLVMILRVPGFWPHLLYWGAALGYWGGAAWHKDRMIRRAMRSAWTDG